MSEIDLTQAEADMLIALEKHCALEETQKPLNYPDLGGRLIVPLLCINRRENFFLDITRSTIVLTKETKQLRGRQVIPLLRLDVGGGAPHRNPDDTEIPSPHLHIYREGYGDKWAIAIPTGKFTDLSKGYQTLIEFMSYCNITKIPHIRKGLFT